MGNRIRSSTGYEEYLKSDVWKCEPSKTGAHHWIEIDISAKTRGMFRCIYCNDVRRFPISYNTVLEKGE